MENASKVRGHCPIQAEDICIQTPRFFLRPLGVGDVTERYAAWLSDASAQRFIAAARDTRDLETLKAYVAQRANRPDVLFLGIFSRSDGVHVGNIKYEPLDAKQGYAVMGMLIGDPAWRGKGVAVEVLEASASWLQANRGISEIVLGVAHDNESAIRAYAAAGFQIAETDRIKVDTILNLTMVRHGGCRA